jgi:hypothetical protein
MPESNMSSVSDYDGKSLVEKDFHPVMTEPVTALAHS